MVLLYSSQQLESESRNSATRWENNWDEGEEIKPNHFPPSHLPNAHPDTHLWMQPGSFLNSRISEHFKEREILPFLIWIFLFYLFYRTANFGTNRNTKPRTSSKDYSQVATCASLSVRLTCTRRSSFECRGQPEVSWWSGRLFSELLRVRMADLSSRGHRQKGNNYPTNLVTCWWLWWDHPEGEKWSKFCWHYLDRPDLERSNYTTGMHTILHSSFILYTIFWPYYKCQNKE